MLFKLLEFNLTLSNAICKEEPTIKLELCT